MSVLPRQRQRHVLYECECEEDVFVSNSREIAMQKVDPSVEGFYESKIPLDFRAIYELGCMCGVLPSARAHNASHPWNLDQLEKRQKTTSYLATMPRYIYLYVSRTQDGHFASFALYFPAQQEVFFVFYTSFVAQQPAPVKGAFQQGATTEEISQLEVKSTYKYTFAEAIDAVTQRLSLYKAEHTGATGMLFNFAWVTLQCSWRKLTCRSPRF